jgi:hypothetical protein
VRLRALLVAAALIAGCGGGDDDGPETPEAKETIQQFQARLTTAVAAIETDRCRVVEQFNAKSGFPLPCDGAAKRRFAGFTVTGSKTYGSGGVIEFRDAETKGKLGVLTVAIGEDGRYHLTGPISPIVDRSTLAQEAERADDMDDAAEGMLESIRAGNCDGFHVPPRPGKSPAESCDEELELYGALRAQLTRDKDAKPERLDGNATFMFYGLRTGDEYRTLVVTREAPGAPKPFVGFVTFRGPA